jgi:D-3-phosphoglycerate dehydrogenase
VLLLWEDELAEYQVLVTDCAWPVLDIERAILAAAGMDLIMAKTGDEAELVALAPQVDAILTTWRPITARVLDAAQQCRTVSNYGVGIDNIDLDHATELGIIVSYVPDYCVEEVSDHAMALLLACARRIGIFDRDTRQGHWNRHAGRPMHRIRGRTLGLIGYGNTARALVPKARGFGLRIMAYNPYLEEGVHDSDVTVTHDLPALLAQADFVSIHAPLTDETQGMFNADLLRQMQPHAFLINTSRGGLVDDAALYQALTEGWIAGAGLDVLMQEPPPAGYPLLSLDTVIVTPHAAFDSQESLEELQTRAANHVVQVFNGGLPEVVANPAVLARDNLRRKNACR